MKQPIKITFNGSLTKLENINIDLSETIKELFYLDNSGQEDTKFYNSLREKTNLPLTEEGGDYYLVRSKDKELYLPTGLLFKLVNYLKSIEVPFTLEKKVSPTELERKDHIPTLRPDQIEVVDKILKHKRGIVKAFTRWGKSYCLSDFLNQFSAVTSRLVLVPKVDLMYQMRKDIATVLGIEEGEIGLIGDSKLDIKPIVVGIPDTFANRIQNGDLDILEYLSKVKVVVMDELHTCLNVTNLVISDNLVQAEYVLGLSATPYIPNFLILEGMVGDVIIEKTEKEGIELGIIDVPTMFFHSVPGKVKLSPELERFEFKQFGPKEMKIFNTLYDSIICLNPHRNNKAVKVIEKRVAEGRSVLVLVKKVGTAGGVNHGGIIRNLLLEVGIDFPLVTGKVKNREDYFNKLETGELQGIIASTGILTYGVTIKAISSLVLLCAGSESKGQMDSRLIKDFVQRVGRTLTKKEGKMKPVIDDFIDCQSVFIKQSQSRINAGEEVYGSENVIIFKDKLHD